VTGRGLRDRYDGDAIVQRIYDTVDDDIAWTDVLAVLTERIGGENGLILGIPTQQAQIPFGSLHRLDSELLQKFNQTHLDNPWARSGIAHPIGAPVISDAHAPFHELKKTEFFGDILQPQRIAHAAVYRLHSTPHLHVGMSVHRSAGAGPFSLAEVAPSVPLLPHLQRAVQLRMLLDARQEEQRLALAALEGLAAGVLLLDGAGRALFANRAARELAAARDAIMMDARGVHARHRLDDRAFQLLIGSAVAGGASGAVALSRASGSLPLVALVVPLIGTLAATAATAGLSSGAAAVFLTDPERQAEPPAERLQALYGLTPTEARVALHLVRAGTIARAAHALGLAPETVRTHLKRIYGKTGVHHQSALARLLSAAAVLNAP
jgi:DNA-binding CsgD family transcriptional regulator/PAS domain-containing protein